MVTLFVTLSNYVYQHFATYKYQISYLLQRYQLLQHFVSKTDDNTIDKNFHSVNQVM